MAYWKEQQRLTSQKQEEERLRRAAEATAAEASRAEYSMHLRLNAISIHKCIGEFLQLRGGWDKTLNPDQKCDLFLAGWCGGGVEWAALGSTGSAHAGKRLLTNYYRGYQKLCYKDTCALNLQVRQQRANSLIAVSLSRNTQSSSFLSVLVCCFCCDMV